jgi:oxygen-independent coproporphyrinogen III oxidase
MTAALGAAGVARASLGVQCFDPMVQSAINRVQSFEQTAAAVQGLREAGVRGINLDLVYGLPHQTVSSCVDTVAQCMTLRPDRLAVFGYAHLPSFKKHQRKINEVILPQAGARLAQAHAIDALLVDAGYRRIGLDHYARPDDSMALALDRGTLHRNFQGYTTDGCEVLLGFGASAIGRLAQGYVQNEAVIGRYAERIARGELPIARGHALTQEDRLRADLIERLLCDFRVDVARVCLQHEQPAPCLDKAFPALAGLERDGLIQLTGSVHRGRARGAISGARRGLRFRCVLGDRWDPQPRGVVRWGGIARCDAQGCGAAPASRTGSAIYCHQRLAIRGHRGSVSSRREDRTPSPASPRSPADRGAARSRALPRAQ